MPMDLFLIYQEEMGRIEASERLALITTFALGSGSLKKEDSRRIFSQLERLASGKKQPKEKMVVTRAALADIGIGVEKVKKENG